MVEALFISHRGERCGVWQFGWRLFHALSQNPQIHWRYAECANLDELLATAAAEPPDLILCNYHPFTLAWAAEGGIERTEAVIFSVFHEVHQAAADTLRPGPFDFLLCPDPTLLPHNPMALPVPRFIPPPLSPARPPPEIFTIGSFGFATPGKGFERLCRLVNEECDAACIRIHIPFHDSEVMAPRTRMAEIAAACRDAITKPQIALEITHDFMEESALLAFLAGNTINAFLYDEAPSRGLSSCIDYALACGRPIAVSRSSMFRHLHGINPSIIAGERPLAAIAAAGTAPLRHHRAAYAPMAAGLAWNQAILRALANRERSKAVPDGRGFNKNLNAHSRLAYSAALAELNRLAPMTRTGRTESGDIRQAFVLDAYQRLNGGFPDARILAIGAPEDAWIVALRAKGFRIEVVDPAVGGGGLAVFYRSAEAMTQSYDMILCPSALVHVPDDLGFIRTTADLLAADGIAIFTTGGATTSGGTGHGLAAGQRLGASFGFYQRLMSAIPDCALLDLPSWNEEANASDSEDSPGCAVSFAFRKLAWADLRHAIPDLVAAGGPPWKNALAAADAEAAQLAETLAFCATDLALLKKRIGAQIETEAELRDALADAEATILDLRKAQEVSEEMPPERTRISPPAKPSLRSIGKRLLKPLWRLVRPVVRPLLWRGRTFLLGPATQELADLRAQQQLLAEAIERLNHGSIATGGAPASTDARPAGISRELEAALLTVALAHAPPKQDDQGS